MLARTLTVGLLLLTLLASSAGCRTPAESGHAATGKLALVRLPDGFRISAWADDLPDARSLALGPKGTVFVGSRTTGEVRALRDTDGDGVADRRWTVATGLNMPNGVAMKDGALYVAEVHRVLRFDGIEDRLDDPPAPVPVGAPFPRDRHHGWKYVAFGPDGKLYVPVGAPCNVCDPGEPYASICRMNADGSGRELVARGVRNTVGFDWHPTTGELWFTDNGRDWLGDDSPPDELNRARRAGLHFGFPHCHAGTIADPELGGAGCDGFEPPAKALGAHVAALGIEFYEGASFPKEHRGRLFVCEHGSWNRSSKVGYRVMMATIAESQVVAYEPFAEGFLQGEEPWGRPVDLETLPDGSLLVSDDFAGAIYRITYAR